MPFVVVVAVLFGLMALAARNRRRHSEAEVARANAISVGTDVMTTSGLYGTVVARNDDDSVQLSIAPGVEVRWAAAALRDVAELPDRYRPQEHGADGEHEHGAVTGDVSADVPDTPDGT